MIVKESVSLTLSLIQEYNALCQEQESTHFAHRMVFCTSTVTTEKRIQE